MCGIFGGSKKEWNYEAGITAIRHCGPDKQQIIREEYEYGGLREKPDAGIRRYGAV